MSRALNELEFPVTHCPEIFAALEKVTAHNYAIVVADWDDGVEAIFLLKTARELKCNSSAFRIVLAKPEAAAAAQQAGAHLVITKPILPGHTKYALLTSDVFIGRVQEGPATILAGDVPPPTPSPAAAKTEVAQPALHAGMPFQAQNIGGGVISSSAFSPGVGDANAREQARPAVRSAPDAFRSGLNPNLPLSLNFATLDNRDNFFRRLGIKFDPVAARSKPQFRALLAVVILAAVISTVYALSGNTKTEASSVLRQPEPDSAAIRQPDRVAASASHAAPQAAVEIRASEGHRSNSTTPAEAAPEAIPQPVEEPAATEPGTALPEQPTRASIPASLTSSAEIEVGSRSSAPNSAPPLLSGIEPVSLTEDFSEKMLIQRVLPNYPDQARQAGLQGAVLLQAWIRKDGTVRDIKVIRGPLLLGQAAYQAVKQWRYRPYLLNGQFVEAQTYVTVNFRLP